MSQQSRKEFEVWQACEALQAEGQKITYRALGDKLVSMGYKRGSNSEIFRYLSTWRDKSGLETSEEKISTGDQNNFGIVVKSTLETIQQEFLQYSQKTLTLMQTEQNKLSANAANRSSSSTTETYIGNGSDSDPLVVNALEKVFTRHEHALFKLLQQHQSQFDHYMTALEQLRQANNLLTHQMASLRANQSALLNAKEKELQQLNSEHSQEKSRRMHLERQINVSTYNKVES